MIRAKFVVTEITRYETKNFAHVVLQPRYSKTVSQDNRFAEATPNGKFEMDVTNPVVIEQLVPGSVWYIDMELAPAGTSSYHE